MVGVVLQRRLQDLAIGPDRGTVRVCSQRICVVVEGAAVDVRRSEAGFDHVAAAGPGHHIVDAEVVFGVERVVLRRSGEEVAGDADARSFSHILVAARVVLAHDRNLVEHHGRQGRIHVGHEVVFVEFIVVACSGQRLSAHALVLAGPVLVAVLHISRVPVAKLVRGARTELRVPLGGRHVGLERLRETRIAGIGDRRLHHRVLVIDHTIERTQKAALLQMGNRPRNAALVVLPLFKRLGGREGILRIHGRVAKQEVELAMVLVGGGFGDDLHLSAARPVVLRRIGVLVDADLLHGRGGNGGAVGFNAIHQQTGAAGCRRAVVQESAHRRRVVVVEDGQRLQILRGHDRGVAILFRRGQVLVGVRTHPHTGRELSDGQNDPQCRGQRGGRGH